MMQHASHHSCASDSLGSDDCDSGARLNLFANDNTTTVVTDDVVTSLQIPNNNFTREEEEPEQSMLLTDLSVI